MALNNVWEDKQDGIDDILSNDINDIAHAVIEGENTVLSLQRQTEENTTAIENLASEVTNTYETKEDASAKLTEAKDYTDAELERLKYCGGFWGLDLPLIKTITLEESVTSIDILSKAEGIELQEFTVLLFIKYLGDAIESNLNNGIMCLRTIGGHNFFGYKGGYYFYKEWNSFAFWHTKIYNKQFALTDLYSGYGNVSSDIPYQGFQGISRSTPTQYSSYTSFLNETLVDNLNVFISSSDVSKGAIFPQGSMIFLLGR